MAHTVSHRIGEFDVTILTDGRLSFGKEVFAGTDPERIDALLQQAGETEIRTNFNAALIRGGGRTVLVDCGPRDLFGPTCGNLPAALAEAGVAPDEVDTLFITHLHPDHIAGAITPEGATVFGKAELVVPEADHAFWSEPIPGADDTLTGWQTLAQAVLAAYAGRIRLVSGAGEVAPGLSALPLPGHTPGHAGFRLASGAAQLVHVGDIVHAPRVQLADPEIGVAFDIDPDVARDSRKRLLDMLASDGAAVTGGHLLAPALARVVRDGAGYRLEDL